MKIDLNEIITIKGKTRTIQEWIKQNSIKVNTLHWRMDHGWKLEDAITKSPRISLLRVGNEEHTVSEWSKITGIPRPVIYDRLKRGYSSEAAVSNDASVFRNGKVMSVNGIVKPIEVWAEETGISVLVLRGRIKHGYSPEEAVTIPAKRYSIRSMITHEGQTMSIEKWSIEKNIDVDVLKSRLNHGWHPDLVLSKELKVIKKRKAPLTYKGETKTIREWAQTTGLHDYIIRARIKAGWPVERILTEDASPRIVVCNGEAHTVAEWSLLTGVSKTTIRTKLNKVVSPEEIFKKRK